MPLANASQQALTAILEQWDLSLPGDVSYQDVIDLCNEVGVTVPDQLTEMLAQLDPDWRTNSYCLTNQPCCVCGSTYRIGLELRFGYTVCQEHSKLSPVEISHQRTDGK